MFIKSLSLENFRNYEGETFSFGEGLNILYGKNGQGKTNCVEAVYYLCTGTSPRTHRDRQLIRLGAESARAEAEISARYGGAHLAANITETGREIFINHNRIARSADLLGKLCCVFFSPRELRLIQDGPEERRAFLNVAISQMNKKYYIALQRYGKILTQRNTLLKEDNVKKVYDTLPVWDEQLCKYGATIAFARKEFVERLAPAAKEAHLCLSDGTEELEVSLEKKYVGDEAEIEKRLYSELSSDYDKDIRQRYTGSGPHRDDMDIVINGRDAKNFASQGQTRTAALSLILAQVGIFTEEAGEPPVLILDDVLSELDLPRRKKLIEKTDGLQTIITCTHASRALYGKEATRMQIEGGRLKR
ncbi:MAG: DNA replication/repair protein RecF [Clostridia bacterium]|nr:DNA replication/repair protein RecF [Clostridia bacterium]